MPREVSVERLIKDAHRVLENPFWIPDLKSDEIYERVHDDHDGTFEGRLEVFFDKMGDAYIASSKHPISMLRYRTWGGGGLSPRVRNALMILAWAIKLDNEEKPLE
jgi:hypothetical protein